MILRNWPASAFALAVFGVGLNATAQQPAAPAGTKPSPVAPVTPDFNAKELAARQQAIEREYKAFTLKLVSLARKLKASPRVEDQDKAKTLEKAIELADKEAVDNKFTTLLRTLSNGNNIGINDLSKAAGQQDDIIKVMAQILAILNTDDELARIKAEREALERHRKELDSLIRGEKIIQSRNESGKGDKDQLAKEQAKLKERTDKLADAMGAPKSDKGGDPKGADPKGNPRDGGKGPEDKGGDKKDTDKPKGEAGKPGDPKEPKPGMGGEGKPSSGPPKEGGDSKPSKPMSGGAGEPKEGAKPQGDPKKDDIAKENKPAESRNKEDNKGDQKGSASASKPGEKSDAQAGAKPSSPSSSQQASSGKPSSGSPSGSPPPSSPSPSKPPAPGADQVRKSIPDQNSSAENLEKDNRAKAGEDQANAIKKMEEAKLELEKRLKQLREQELERLLANLEQRVGKLLAMQIEVKSATTTIDGQIMKNPDQKPRPIDFQNSQKQEDREADIIAEADKTLELLRNEGSAVAFPAVFEEVRQDMVRVKERLHNANVGADSQALEQDIIDALSQMKDALKKAQQELGKSPPMPPGDPPPSGDQLKKLLDEIAELKLIRQQQVTLNTRTTRYGERYKGEQAEDTQIKKELKDLGERQEKLEIMIHNMVTGKNK